MRINARYLAALLMVPLLSGAQLAAAGPDNPLVEAVKNGRIAAVRTLIQQHADASAPEGDGTTALHWAARQNDLEIVDLLLGAGAQVKAANRYGVTPLAVACTSASAAIVERLVKAGADPNSASPEGETALMTAARTGRVEVVKVLLAHGARVAATERWHGTTALMWAAAEGHAAVAQVLLEGGVDKADIHARSKGGLTALLLAVREGRIEAVRTLLSAGANASDIAPDGTSALVLAIINAHYELAALLLDKGADPNAADSRGSALHALAWMRRPGRAPGAVAQPVPTGNLDSLEVARALLAHGANPNVRIAWKESRKGGFQLGTEVDLPPDIAIGRNYLIFGGATPFYLAAKGSDVDLMRVLAASGADPLIPTVRTSRLLWRPQASDSGRAKAPDQTMAYRSAIPSKPSSWPLNWAATSTRPPTSEISKSRATASSSFILSRSIENSFRRLATSGGMEARRCTARRSEG